MSVIQKDSKFSIITFVIFFIVLSCAIFFYAPGWGFMDDYGNLQLAQKFWEKGVSLQSLGELFKGDMGYGRFRPVYPVWQVTAYAIFANSPTMLYFFISLACFAVMVLWGLMIRRVFVGRDEQTLFPVLVYPLSFFIFTPFWNIFMYVSTLEKFVFLFSGPAIYFLMKAYDRDRIGYLLVAMVWGLLAMFGKETGIAFFMALAVYAFLDVLWFRNNRKISVVALCTTVVLILAYFFFIKSLMGGYTASYKSNFNLSTVIASIMGTKQIIKLLLVFAAGWIGVYFVLYLMGKVKKESSLALMFPLFLGAFLVVLSPWKFVNYLLAPLAPFVMAMLFPIFKFVCDRHVVLKWTARLAVICLSFLVLWTIIMPRISKMADKRKIAAHIQTMKTENSTAQYFFPPPFIESSDMLGRFAGVKLNYLSSGILDGNNLDSNVVNYLVVGDQEGPVKLKDVSVDNIVYQNNTWRIFAIHREQSSEQTFRVDFPRNSMQKLKDYVKKL